MLKRMGWNDYFEALWCQLDVSCCVPGRVISQHRGIWRVALATGETDAEVSGRLRFTAEESGTWPVVGDWVAMDGDPQFRMRINAILPRRTAIVRKMAGRGVEEQVLAANVDAALLLMGLDGDYNLRRLERYLTLAWDCGVRPVVILNKQDLCVDAAARVAEVERLALGSPVFAISALSGKGLDSMMRTLTTRTTLVLLGSSGAGKSTLANQLMSAEVQPTRAVRASDSRGRHTTTGRQLFALPNGALLIDTPGLRELQLWEASDGLARAFADIGELATQCRFGDCSHQGEPGCAVTAAIATGELAAERLENLRKLEREQEFLKRKIDPENRQREKKIVKSTHRATRRLYQQREKEGK